MDISGKNESEKEKRSYPKTVEQIELERRAEEDRKRAAASADRHGSSAVSRKRPLLLRVFLWWLAVVIAVLASLAFAHLFCRDVIVRDGSMEPTLSTGDICLINRFSYFVGDPARGDIVVFRYKSDSRQDEAVHIKRVIGLPGETVQIRDGEIYINGEKYNETGDFAEIIDPGNAADPVTLSDNEYFVLGDNRNGSEDSRYTTVGIVNGLQITGRIWLRIAPVGNFGLIR